MSNSQKSFVFCRLRTNQQLYSLRFCAFALISLLLLLGCEAAVQPKTAVPLPTATPIPAPTLAQTTEWQPLDDGFEQREIIVRNERGELIDRFLVFRLEPEKFLVRVGYRPAAPLTLPQWQAETAALLVVNASFFTENFVATGLVVADGQASGSSYLNFGGMLSEDDSGAIRLRSLAVQPYDPAEPLQQAVQAFPMLVQAGGVRGYAEEDGQQARRTAVALDRNGRLLFIFAPSGRTTLAGLSQFLVDSTLDIEVALNLDGGTSSGYLLAEPFQTQPTFVPLPTVILIEKRP